MNCGRFLLLLDAGDAASLDREALAHAESCELCARALAEALALERELASHLGPAAEAPPAGFADRLMARVERMPQSRLAPADVARATLAAFATPPIAASLAGAAALLGFAWANGFDAGRMTATTAAAAAPLAGLMNAVTRPLPTTGLAADLAVAGVLLAGVPVLLLLLGGAWLLGNLIGERAPRPL